MDDSPRRMQISCYYDQWATSLCRRKCSSIKRRNNPDLVAQRSSFKMNRTLHSWYQSPAANIPDWIPKSMDSKEGLTNITMLVQRSGDCHYSRRSLSFFCVFISIPVFQEQRWENQIYKIWIPKIGLCSIVKIRFCASVNYWSYNHDTYIIIITYWRYNNDTCIIIIIIIIHISSI